MAATGARQTAAAAAAAAAVIVAAAHRSSNPCLTQRFDFPPRDGFGNLGESSVIVALLFSLALLSCIFR